MPQRDWVSSKKLTWINIVKATKKDTDYLKKKFKFNELDLQDSLAHSIAQRPKIYFRANYLFMILLFPVYNPKTRTITPAEVDIFVTRDHVITMHNNKLLPLKNFFKTLKSNPQEKNSYMNQTPAMFLYEILDQLYTAKFPMLDHISIDINNIEENIFKEKEREMVNEILIIKRNIVYFKKIMQAHKNTLKKIMLQKNNWFGDVEDIKIYYNDLVDYMKNIWDILENYQQTINALEDTNNILVSFRINNIMRTLTIFSVIVFPLTLMAALFGMNASFIPLVGQQFDFWIILGIMLVATIIMYIYFKKKKWF